MTGRPKPRSVFFFSLSLSLSLSFAHYSRNSVSSQKSSEKRKHFYFSRKDEHDSEASHGTTDSAESQPAAAGERDKGEGVLRGSGQGADDSAEEDAVERDGEADQSAADASHKELGEEGSR